MHSIPLRYSYDPSPSSYLRFFDEAVVSTQARLHNRRMLTPVIDLDDYRCRAVIDFIEVEIATCRPTGMPAVRNWIIGAVKSERVFCKHLDGTPNSSRTFLVRIQEPTAAMLSTVERAIYLSCAGLAQPVCIRILEVSLDIYAKSGSTRDREKMVALLQRTYLPGMDTWTHRRAPRFVVGDEPRTTHLIKHRDLVKSVDPEKLPPPPPLDSTQYWGAEEGPWMVRVQNKVTDQRNGHKVRLLPGREKRARIEVTLSGSTLRELGLTKLSSLSSFCFARLQGAFFHFALPTFADKSPLPQHAVIASEVNRADRECFSRGGIVCLERWRHLKEQWLSAKPQAALSRQSPLQRLRADLEDLGRNVRYRRAGTGRYGTSVSYKELNEIVSSALRDLDRRTRF